MTTQLNKIPVELVLDINPGIGSSDPVGLTRAGGMLFFFANDGINGQGLYLTGPIKELTRRVGSTDVDLLVHTPVATPSGKSIFFWNRQNGTTELWTANLNPEMKITRQIHAGQASPGYTTEILTMRSGHLPESNQNDGYDIAYFSAYRDATGGDELWRSDGTDAGTFLIRDTTDWSEGLKPSEVPPVMPSNPRGFTRLGDEIYYSADGRIIGRELYKSDGHFNGTQVAYDVVPGPVYPNGADSDPRHLTAVGDYLYFSAWTEKGGGPNRDLVRYDPKENTVSIIKDINASKSLNPTSIVSVRDRWVYFSGDDGVHGRELWTTRVPEPEDGLIDGLVYAKMVIDINKTGESNPHYLTPAGSKVFFAASESGTGSLMASPAVWVTDNSKTIKLENGGLEPVDFVVSSGLFDRHVYYIANDPKDGARTKIFRSDGTEEGTYPLNLDLDYNTQTIFRGVNLPRTTGRQDALEKVGNYLYFSMHDYNGIGRELYRIDIRNINSDAKTSPVRVEYSNSTTLDDMLNLNNMSSESLESVGISEDIVGDVYMDVTASTWTAEVKITRYAFASDNGDILEGKQRDPASTQPQGSILKGGKASDRIQAKAGFDIVEGGDGNDLVRAGNGRDIITGGLGSDELWGGFGWNTFKGDRDGSEDLLVIKSDEWLVNPLIGKSGNNSDGSKCDIIEELDPIDKIIIQGVETSELLFSSNTSAKGISGIGIYANGSLEALYTGGDLTVAQLTAMTTGDLVGQGGPYWDWG